MQDLKQEVNDLKFQNEQKQADLDKALRDLEDYKNKYKQQQQEINSLKDKFSNSNSTLADLEEKIDDL